MNRRVWALICCFGLLLLAAPTAPVSADVRKTTPVRVRHTGPDYNDGHALPVKGRYQARDGSGGTAARLRVGTNRQWLAVDDIRGEVYLKRYKLRGKGDHIEVWVANDTDQISSKLSFPEGDCRNDERVRVTDRQVRYLIRQFDRNIYPKESRAFSVPRKRNGSDALLYDPEIVRPPFPRGYFDGQGDNIVVLVDNVRDDNFYDTDNANELTYIAGFFFSVFNEFHDRNIMTIDAYDWIHRTHANPPNEPIPNDKCESKPARPFLYESVFAHEYQHLLEYYEDQDEVNWVNEGLSDWAQTLTGYTKPRTPITESGFDSHIQCFLGWLEVQTAANPNPRDGGPENSLNMWDEQDEVLCDYGAAYTMMEMLKRRYGRSFMKNLHRHHANGLTSLNRLLRQTASAKSARQVVHEWNAMLALDAVLDDGAQLSGDGVGPLGYGPFRVRSLAASINWDNDDTYSEPGAPPNGADYVRLRGPAGEFLDASDVDSLTFDGAEQLPPLPVEWTVDDAPPAGHDAALYSGSDANLDRAIVQEVNVPRNQATLTFDTYYEIEEQWDFAFVQVSTDGGETWTSLSNADTRSDANPDADPRVVEHLPGFTGNSGCEQGSQSVGEACEPSWVTETFDLSAYAGQDILLSFRYVTDPAADLPGWWIDNVNVGNRNVSNGTTLAGWTTPSALDPTTVEGFTLQLIAYDDAHTQAGYALVPLSSTFMAELDEAELDALLPDGAQTVAALVTYDESTEQVVQYAPYELKVNGTLQPGGS